jgi:hypothetical protein
MFINILFTDKYTFTLSQGKPAGWLKTVDQYYYGGNLFLSFRRRGCDAKFTIFFMVYDV